MLILFFSGTGNTKYIAQRLSKKMNAVCHSIEEDIDFASIMQAHGTICCCYPIYMSRVPPIFVAFAKKYKASFKNKKVMIFVTQFMFSGDGARAFVDLFPRSRPLAKSFFDVVYAEHFFMPNNVCNLSFLPVKNGAANKRVLRRANSKIDKICMNIANGRTVKRGFNMFSKIAGLSQGLSAENLINTGKCSVVVDKDCVNCGHCVKICPVGNLELVNNRVEHKNNCTLCYRCVNSCPKMAITTLIHRKPRKQYRGV